MKPGRLTGLCVIAVVAIGVGAMIGFGVWSARRTSEAASTSERKCLSLRPGLGIDTNAVLVDVLAGISDTVRRLKVPLATPLTTDKVMSFETRPVLKGRPSSLHSELIYEGGYEFRHQDGILLEFRAPDSVRKSDVVRIPSARPGYSRETVWTNIQHARLISKAAFRRLGHTNLALFDKDPYILDRWADWMDSDPPHWFLTWSDPKEGSATVEIDAETLTLKHYALSIVNFGREPWPTTLTHSRPQTIEEFDADTAPDWSALQLTGVDRDHAVALIRTILPEAMEFCADIGPPFPTHFAETDIEPAESMAATGNGRIWMRLRLKSGFTISYHQGRIVGVRAPDSAVESPTDGYWPDQDGLFRQSEEYVGPTRVTAQQAVAKVRNVAVNRLGLPRTALGLDNEPEFHRSVDPTATNGLRRYIIHWNQPETEQEREERERYYRPPDTTVWGEVDAVSGELKCFVEGGKALFQALQPNSQASNRA
jgi:hypothetical protein